MRTQPKDYAEPSFLHMREYERQEWLDATQRGIRLQRFAERIAEVVIASAVASVVTIMFLWGAS